MPAKNPSKSGLPLLALILILGAFLRFYGIHERGPSFFDEGVYTLEGKWLYTFSKLVYSSMMRKIEEVRSGQDVYTFEKEAKRFEEGMEGEPPVWGRPGFSLLTAICMGLMGPRVYAANVVSAFLGTLSILGIFILGRAMWNEKIALLASFLLAISGYHLVYSFTGFADGSAMCFSIFAFYLYYGSCTHKEAGGHYLWIALSGLMCGVAFSMHDRFLYVFLVIAVNEGIDLCTQRDRIVLRLKRVLALGASFVFLLGLFEFPYYVGMLSLRHFDKVLPFRTYFEELLSHHMLNFFDAFAFSLLDLSRYPELREAGSHLYNFLTYPYLFFSFNGSVFCIMFLTGIVTTVIQKRHEDRLLLLWFLIPFVMFSVGLATSVRYALVFMPAVILIASRSLYVYSEALMRMRVTRSTLRFTLGAALVLLIAANAWYSSRDIRVMRCSYKAPAEFLKEHRMKHISTQYPVTKAYMGVKNVREPPCTMEDLKKYYKEGFRYYLIDFRKVFMKPPFDSSDRATLIEDIESTVQPVFSYVHPCYTAPCFVFEINIFFRYTLKILREAHRMGVDQIRIYDLDEYFEKKGDRV